MRLTVKVIPRAKVNKIIYNQQEIKVYLTKPAVEGKANKQLCKILADYFKVKPYQIQIIKGEKSRSKLIQVDGI